MRKSRHQGLEFLIPPLEKELFTEPISLSLYAMGLGLVLRGQVAAQRGWLLERSLIISQDGVLFTEVIA